jgi:hypothetical protein
MFLCVQTVAAVLSFFKFLFMGGGGGGYAGQFFHAKPILLLFSLKKKFDFI